jgi:hypothetical protein
VFGGAAVIFLVHGLYFLLVFSFRRFEAKGMSRACLRAAYLNTAAAFAAFLVSVVPLGVVVNEAVTGLAWGGWPLGARGADTRSQVVLLLWAALLVWRIDLVGAKGMEKPGSDRIFTILFLVALLVTAVAFILPALCPCSGH